MVMGPLATSLSGAPNCADQRNGTANPEGPVEFQQSSPSRRLSLSWGKPRTTTHWIPCLLMLLSAGSIATAADVGIVFPSPGAVVNVGTLVQAVVDPSVDPTQIDSVSFEYSPDTVAWFEITAPGPAGMADYLVLWNAGSLSRGSYYLRAKLLQTSGAVAYSSYVGVQVNAQPVAKISATRASTLYRIHYDATSSFDPDGTIVNYDWDFGDGTRGSGATVDHQYPSPGAYGIAMTVTDNQGGSSTSHTILALSGQGPIKVKNKDTCGCKKMTVKSTDNVEGPDGFDFSMPPTSIPGAEKTKLGAYQAPATGNQLDMTMNTFAIRFRFEVIADLNDESKPQLCEEGQRAQFLATDPTDGKLKTVVKPLSSDPRYDSSQSTTDPFNGMMNGNGKCRTDQTQNWCDDDYHGGGNARGAGSGNNQPPSPFKHYEDEARILWLDAPGTGDYPKAAVLLYGQSLTANYEATVSGPNNASPCKCTWTVMITVDMTGKVTANKIVNLTCTP